MGGWKVRSGRRGRKKNFSRIGKRKGCHTSEEKIGKPIMIRAAPHRGCFYNAKCANIVKE